MAKKRTLENGTAYYLDELEMTRFRQVPEPKPFPLETYGPYGWQILLPQPSTIENFETILLLANIELRDF